MNREKLQKGIRAIEDQTEYDHQVNNVESTYAGEIDSWNEWNVELHECGIKAGLRAELIIRFRRHGAHDSHDGSNLFAGISSCEEQLLSQKLSQSATNRPQIYNHDGEQRAGVSLLSKSCMVTQGRASQTNRQQLSMFETHTKAQVRGSIWCKRN
jgi:hypothetical protein